MIGGFLVDEAFFGEGIFDFGEEFFTPAPASAYKAAVLADTPLLYWRLGETSGSTAVDTSGNGHAGTYVGPPTLGATSLLLSEPTNAAMTVLTNSGQRASIASAAWMNVNSLTAEAWVNFSSAIDATNGDAIVSRYDGTGFNWTVVRSTTGLFQAQIRNTSGTAYNVFGPAVTIGTTYHVACTYDGSNFILYVNGVSAGSVTVTGTVQTGSAPIEAGQYSGASSTTPTATIDEVAVYGTALSAARIAAHYLAGIGSYADTVAADSPVGYWKLDDGTSLTAVDSSATRANGTWNTAPTSAASLINAGTAIVAPTSGSCPLPSTTFASLANVTLEGWFKTTDTTNFKTIHGWDVGGAAGKKWYLRMNGQALEFYTVVAGGFRGPCTATGSWSDGLPHHAVGTYDGTTMRIYVDGVQRGTLAQSGALDFANGSAQIANGLGGSPWIGTLDELAIYPTALSAARVAAHYAAGTAPASSTTRTGTAAVTLGGLTVAATSTRTLSRTATAPLGALTVAATGTRKTFGTTTVPLGALTVASTGTRQVTGTAAAPLGTLTVAATSVAHSTINGTAALPLGALVVTSRAATVGSGTVTLGALTVSSSGFRRRSGTASLPLGSLTVTGAGTVRRPGIGSVTLGSLTVASVGGVVHVVSGTAAVLLGGVDVQAIGHPVHIPPTAVSVLSAGSTSVTVTAAVSGVAYTAAYSTGRTVVQVSALGRQTTTVLVAGGTAVTVGVSARQWVSVGPVAGSTLVTLLYTPDDGNGGGNVGNDPILSNNQPITAGVALTGHYLSGEEA